MPEIKRCVLSLSGGMDSTSLCLHMLNGGYQVYGLSFQYGQKHAIELERLRENLSYLKSKGFNVYHQLIDLSSTMGAFDSALTKQHIDVPEGHYAEDNMRSTVVPNRNAIFASIIYGYALSLAQEFEQEVKLGLGVHAGDHAIYPDCRPEFYDAIDKAFKLGNWNSELANYYLPYLSMNKADILQDAIKSTGDLSLDFTTIFRNTLTCYKPNSQGQSCGRCGSCNERLEAFEIIGKTDPAPYFVQN